MHVTLAPGAWVRLPSVPEWGIGQIQSAIGMRVTVNFVHAGKRLVHADRVALEPADPPDGREGPDDLAKDI